MAVRVDAYNYVSEIPALLEKTKKDFLPDNGDVSFLRFVVPSRNDKSWLPEKNINPKNIWTWDEIYKDIAALSGKTKSVLSPPDHLLILNSILKNVLAQYPEKLEKLPGLKRAGFLGVISSDIRELLNEAVNKKANCGTYKLIYKVCDCAAYVCSNRQASDYDVDSLNSVIYLRN